VLLESLAAGLAPFASDHPPIRWVLGALGDGSLVPDDDDAWTPTITAIEDDTTVDEVGRKARQLYVDRFTPATARTRLERIYETAINRHRVSHH
jgi:glycosyltransferase involved in cell wall biosynthesis